MTLQYFIHDGLKASTTSTQDKRSTDKYVSMQMRSRHLSCGSQAGHICHAHNSLICTLQKPPAIKVATEISTMASQIQNPIQQQSSQDTMHPPSLPIKPIEYLYSSMRPSFLKSQSNSLNSFMGNGSSLSAVRSAFLDMEKQRTSNTKAVNFECDYGYGYGYGKDSEQEPPSKRRRFQRRNSKTPAMLMSISASLVQLEYLDEEKKEEEEKLKLLNITKKEEISDEDDDDDWDGGLEIAEELVKHLQQRRRSSSMSSVASISFR
jgi:hypothetical protein